MGELIDKLKEYTSSDAYAFHMPGHKRKAGFLSLNPCMFDITEIKGFDDLHNPKDILLGLKKRAADMYGAEDAYILVNGSSSGILSAVSAAAGYGGRILAARNCHRSVYNAVMLRGLYADYVYPQYNTELGIYEAVSPNEVEKALRENPFVEAVVITSPTYEGAVSDIGAIAEIVHGYGIPLIVDSAHGAHACIDILGMENPVLCGADIVVASLHKTLPALTQTAVMLVQGKLVNRDVLDNYFHVYTTSSPSYVLMASVEACMDFLDAGEKQFTEYKALLQDFYKGCVLDKLMLYKTDDLGKIVIGTWKSNINGLELSELLRNKYLLETEMASKEYVLAMTSVLDDVKSFERLKNALIEIDRRLLFRDEKPAALMPEPVIRKNIFDAVSKAADRILLKDSTGFVSGDFIYAYPPGIPLIAPGELFTEEIIKYIHDGIEAGLNICGIKEDMSVKVCI